MISLLAALMAGYALATFTKGERAAYLLCFPTSAVVYLLTKLSLHFLVMKEFNIQVSQCWSGLECCKCHS